MIIITNNNNMELIKDFSMEIKTFKQKIIKINKELKCNKETYISLQFKNNMEKNEIFFYQIFIIITNYLQKKYIYIKF